ncbi:MAG: MBL fold metallo-hydrolase [Methylococcaceae bacterium]
MIFTELNQEKCKTYLIGCDVHNKAVLVDPVTSHIDRYLAILAYYGLRLELVIDTHTHADHRSALKEIKALTGCNIARHLASPQPNVDRHLNDGDSIELGDVKIDILHTPGHTPDSISLHIQDRVLTGDCLLIGGTGRTDFAGGDAGDQYDSIAGKLFALADETLVFPAHDYRGNTSSTIGYEKSHNPRVRGRSRDEYIQLMKELGLPLPEKIQEVLQINASESQDTEIAYPSIAELNQVFQVSQEYLQGQLKGTNPPLVLDVRDAEEYQGELGHIEGSLLIPLAELPKRFNELDEYRKSRIITVCRAGVRSTTAAAMLIALGFSGVANLSGGMVSWQRSQLSK